MPWRRDMRDITPDDGRDYNAPVIKPLAVFLSMMIGNGCERLRFDRQWLLSNAL